MGEREALLLTPRDLEGGRERQGLGLCAMAFCILPRHCCQFQARRDWVFTLGRVHVNLPILCVSQPEVINRGGCVLQVEWS